MALAREAGSVCCFLTKNRIAVSLQQNREKELSRTYLVEQLNEMKDKKSFLETLIPTT